MLLILLIIVLWGSLWIVFPHKPIPSTTPWASSGRMRRTPCGYCSGASNGALMMEDNAINRPAAFSGRGCSVSDVGHEVNPASGLPMIGSMDIEGNPFGTSSDFGAGSGIGMDSGIDSGAGTAMHDDLSSGIGGLSDAGSSITGSLDDPFAH